MEGFTKRTISVYNEKVTLFCISVHMTCSLQTASAHQVFQLHMTNWNPDGSIPELAPLVSVINETSAIQRRTGNKSVLVHCRSDNVHNAALYYGGQPPQYEYCGSVYLPQGIFTHCPPLGPRRLRNPEAIVCPTMWVSAFIFVLSLATIKPPLSFPLPYCGSRCLGWGRWEQDGPLSA